MTCSALSIADQNWLIYVINCSQVDFEVLFLFFKCSSSVKVIITSPKSTFVLMLSLSCIIIVIDSALILSDYGQCLCSYRA